MLLLPLLLLLLSPLLASRTPTLAAVARLLSLKLLVVELLLSSPVSSLLSLRAFANCCCCCHGCWCGCSGAVSCAGTSAFVAVLTVGATEPCCCCDAAVILLLVLLIEAVHLIATCCTRIKIHSPGTRWRQRAARQRWLR